MEGFSSQTPDAGGDFPPSRDRGSSQILATSSLLYFTEVKPILKFNFQKRFLDHFSEEGSEPISEPLRGPVAVSQEFPEQAAPEHCRVCVCLCTSDRRVRRHCHHQEITNNGIVSKVRQGFFILTETDRA